MAFVLSNNNYEKNLHTSDLPHYKMATMHKNLAYKKEVDLYSKPLRYYIYIPINILLLQIFKNQATRTTSVAQVARKI